MKRLKLKSDKINELCALLPQSDQFDYYDLRSGKISFEEFKLRVMNVDRNFIVTRQDLIDRGVPLEYFIRSDLIDERIKTYNEKHPNK
jgi:hypothetical protein